MQAVIALPNRDKLGGLLSPSSPLLRRVCGVPLIARVIATAARSGVTEVLLIGNGSDAEIILDVSSPYLKSPSREFIQVISTQNFNPASGASWKAISAQLESELIWIPWNWVTYPHALSDLSFSGGRPQSWSVPVRMLRSELIGDESDPVSISINPQGVAVGSEAALIQAERFLVKHSGKRLDGIHSKFNRWLCRPFVEVLARTRVTPNAVTLAGLCLAVASASFFARGTYLNAVAGALFFFMSGLADDADGMLARIKFADSSFGCWFEGFVDNASYVLLFLGVTLGLSAQGYWPALLLGGLSLLGCSISIAVIALQRRKATLPDHPNEYLGNVYGLLEHDSGSFISRVTRQVHFLTKKGVLIHYVLLFTLLGWLPLMLWLVLIGSHLTWIITLYLDHRFFKPAHTALIGKTLETEKGGRIQ